jgi:hypothetical protein
MPNAQDQVPPALGEEFERRRRGNAPGRRTTNSGGSRHLDLHLSTRHHRGDVWQLAARVEKVSLPRKGAKREESTTCVRPGLSAPC